MTKGNLIFTLRDDWTFGGQTYKQGSLLAFPLKGFLADRVMRKVAVLYAPDAHSTVESVSTGRDAVYASIFSNVTGSIHVFTPGEAWSDKTLALPARRLDHGGHGRRLGARGALHL